MVMMSYLGWSLWSADRWSLSNLWSTRGGRLVTWLRPLLSDVTPDTDLGKHHTLLSRLIG